MGDRISGRHHAYLILDDGALATRLEKTKGRADSHFFSFVVLGINEARSLRELQTTRAAAAGRRYFVIKFAVITEEAQNALLKTVEEPGIDTVFIFLTGSKGLLLPTFLSRLELIAYQGKEKNAAAAENFTNADPETRLTLVTDLLAAADKADENPKGLAIEFLDNLERYLAQTNKLENAAAEFVFALEQIRESRQYLHDKSGTPKLILEHLALTLPASI